MGHCPSVAQLEAFAARGADDAVGSHVARCEMCRASVIEIKDNQRFLASAGGALLDAIRGQGAHPLEPSGRLHNEPAGLQPDLADPHPFTSASDREHAHAVPGYDLVAEIGRGGQGIVYRAVQTATRRPCAVKVLLRGFRATIKQQARFEREIELAASLRHASIVTIFESGQTADGHPYVSMELVEGRPIDEYVKDQPWGPVGGRTRIDAVVRLFAQVAEALGHAHSLGVIHRDLKPTNIFVDKQGVPRVLDFGLARHDDSLVAKHNQATATLEFAGTPAYAAPEQLSGEGPLTARSDVYALGVSLYAVLTGQHPYPCDVPFASILRHAIFTEPEPLSKHLPRVSADVETIVHKALAKDPMRRYSSGNSLAADLNRCLAGEAIEARRDSTWYVIRKTAAKHRVPVIAGLTVLATIAMAMVGLALLARSLDSARAMAEAALAESESRRARLLASTGDIEQAEEGLWRSALRSGFTGEGEIALAGDSGALRSAWSLIELYSRLPRRFRVKGEAVFVQCGIDASSRTIWTVARDGAKSVWSLAGDQHSRTPAIAADDPRFGAASASPNGRFAVVVDGAGVSLHDLEQGRLIASASSAAVFSQASAVLNDGSLVVGLDLTSNRDVVLYEPKGKMLHECHRFHDQASTSRFDECESGTRLLTTTYVRGIARVIIRQGPSWPIVREVPLTADWLTTPAAASSVRHAFLNDTGTRLAVELGARFVLFDPATQPTRLIGQYSTNATELLLDDFIDAQPVIAAASNAGRVAILELPSLEPRATFQDAPAPTSVAFNPGLGVAAIVGGAGHLSVYDAADRPWLARVPTPGYTNAALDVASDGTIAWGNRQGTLFILSGDHARPPVTIAHAHGGHTDGHSTPTHEPIEAMVEDSVIANINSVEFATDGRDEILTGAADGAVKTWRSDGTLVRIIHTGTPGSGVSTARYSPDGSRIAWAGFGRVVRVSSRDGSSLVELDSLSRARVPKVDFSPDGSMLYTNTCDEHERGSNVGLVWDLAAATPRHRLIGHSNMIRAVDWSPDGRWIATGSDDKTVRIWGAASGTPIRTIRGLPWGPWDVVFHGSGRVLIAAGPGGQLVVLDPEAGAEVATLAIHEQSIFDVAISSDGLRLYTSGEDPWIGVIDLDQLRSYVRGNEPYWRGRLGDGTRDAVGAAAWAPGAVR